MSVLNTQIAVDPDDGCLHLELARVLAAMKRPENVLKELDTAISLRPHKQDGYLMRFEIYRERKQLAEAVRDLNAALAIKGAGWIHVARGRMLMEMNDYRGAIKDFNWCIARHQTPAGDAFAEVVPSYYQFRAECERKLGQTARAVRDYKAALVEDPDLQVSRAALEECERELRQ